MRLILMLAALLSCALITAGAALLAASAGLITAGVLGLGLTWLLAALADGP